MQDFRVIELPERTALDASDYAMIDSANNGTNKYLLSRMTAETDAKIATAVSGVEAELNTAVEGIEEDITTLQGDVETVETTLGTKADVNGTYPEMAVGSVLGTNTVTNREPYFIRPSASIGDRAFDTLVGGSLGWNQLSSNLSEITLNKDTHRTENVSTNGISAVPDHVYYASVDITEDSTVSGLAVQYMATTIIGKGVGHKAVVGRCQNAIGYIYTFISNSEASGAELKYKNLNVIDLTTLFGSTIADYIYSLEQANAGAGVAWVRRYLPNDYYAYCAPKLEHVTGVSAHVMRDANDNIIGNYPLDSTWTGMGIPKLDSDGKLYFDGDRYNSDGTVTERYVEITITGDSISIYGTASSGNKYVSGDLAINGQDNLNKISSRYKPATSALNDNAIRTNNTSFYIYDNTFTDLASAKTALNANPVKLVYERTTPATSTATPFTSPQICDKDGTEEYVTTGLVPVGHETEYVENLADKLTDIPTLPTTAGTYRLKVTVSGGVPSYSWVSA